MNMKMVSKCILYQSHVLHILFYSLYFSILSYFIFLSQLRKLVYQDCKQSVGAGMNALMSISDGLGPSIFCRKMEKARPMLVEMDGKVVYFPPESAFLNLMCWCLKYFWKPAYVWTSGDICGKFKLANIYNDSTAETNENPHTFELKESVDVESQRSPLKRNLTSKSGTATE